MKKGRNTCTIHVSRFYWYLSIFLVLISLFWGYVNSWTMEIIFLWSVVIELRRPFDFMDWSSKTIHRKLWSTNTSIDETKVLILKKKNYINFQKKLEEKRILEDEIMARQELVEEHEQRTRDKELVWNFKFLKLLTQGNFCLRNGYFVNRQFWFFFLLLIDQATVS